MHRSWHLPHRPAGPPGIHATLAEFQDKGVEVAPGVPDQGWGLLAAVRLPDGAELPIYEPRHRSPLQP